MITELMWKMVIKYEMVTEITWNDNSTNTKW